MSDVHPNTQSEDDGRLTPPGSPPHPPLAEQGTQEAHDYAIQLSTISSAEKIAILDFERGHISATSDFTSYGMCMLCEQVSTAYHEHTDAHNSRFREYTATLRDLIAITSRSKATEWSRKMCIVHYLSECLMPPVTHTWWHCACHYVMGRHNISRLLTQHTTDQQSNTVQTNVTVRCVVCLEQTRRIMFEPCHHVACCASCSNHVECCPICRQTIDERVVVYMS